MNALVIDDSKTMRTILRGILTSLGFNVLEAADGREAVAQMELATDIVLALVDWNMPVMNGFEFVQEIRSCQAYDSTKLMMVTTEAEMENVIAALEAGADEYLMKPFTQDSVVAKLGILGLHKSD
jgi:two-component system chemotaxis response regulator CheY